MVILTEEERILIQRIGIRISNKDIRVIISEETESYADESFTNEFVIATAPRVDAFTTMAIVVHQGAHHRFHSIINGEIYHQVSVEFPEIAHVVLDAFEDFRCNLLNQQIYPGFVKRFRDYIAETKQFQNGSNILLNTVMQVHQKLEFESVFNASNTYPIWDLLEKQKTFLQEYLSTSAMIIAAKIVVDKIIFYYKQELIQNSEPIQYTQKTRTPNLYSYRIDNPNSKNLHNEYFTALYENGDYLCEIERKLQKERNAVLEQIDEMKKLPETNKLENERATLKMESISPEKYTSGDSYEEIVTRNVSLILALKKEFLQIMRSTNPGRGGRRGKIMARDLPRFVTSKGNYDRVFKIDQNSYGANLMILVDESGSMTTKKLPIAREAIITIMEALDGTKINTCVIGFAAKNHSLIISEKIYKEFNSPIDKKKLASINTTLGYEYNRDGDSFELAAKHFAVTNHLNSLMIIISDGCPNHGSSYTSSEGRRLTNLSIRLLRNRGINVHALGIKIYTPITYSEMYDKKGITFIDTCELEMALVTLIRQIASDLVVDSFNY